MSPKKIDKEIKRKEILEAALKVFSKKGVSNSKIIEIANEAGIGKGTVYEYFKNKDEIFMESFKLFMNQTGNVIVQGLESENDPQKKLESWIDGWSIAISESAEFINILIEYWAEGVRSKESKSFLNIKDMYDNLRDSIVEILDEGVERGFFKPVNTSLSASILIAALDGLALQWILDPDLFDFKEVTETLKTSFIVGLKN